MTDRLTRMLASLVCGLAAPLDPQRRDWVHALVAESDDLPSAPARLAWLGGGLWLVARQVLINRVIQALAFVAGAVALVWIAWPGPASNSATPVNRVFVVGTLVLLAGLPPVVRRHVAPVRPGRAPRLARVGGYGVVLALVAATAVQQRTGSQLGAYFPVTLPVWAADVGLLPILAGYVTGLLILTTRRLRFTPGVLPTALGTGVLTAGLLYPLAPFGLNDTAETVLHSLHGGPMALAGYQVLACYAVAAVVVPLAVHAVATRLADRDPRPGGLGPSRQALLATAGAMATAAILVALSTTATIALAPHRVAGAQRAVADGTCPTCAPSTVVIPANLRHEYAVEAAVNGAGDGTAALLVVPLLGAALGALRGHLRYPPRTASPATHPHHAHGPDGVRCGTGRRSGPGSGRRGSAPRAPGRTEGS
jgi:hypothetical protein